MSLPSPVPPQPDIGVLVAAAIDLVGDAPRVLLGVAGAPGSGKSTLTAALVEGVALAKGPDWVAHVPMDGFHLADVQLDRLGSLHRKGAPDTFDVEGYAALLRRLVDEPGSLIYAPGFERSLEQPIAAAVAVPPSARLVVTEGNYLLLPEVPWQGVRAMLTQVWFVTVDDALRRSRLVERHVAHGKEPAAAAAWVERSDESNAALVTAYADHADRLVVNGPSGWSLLA